MPHDVDSYGGPACADDLLKGNQDTSLITRLQSTWDGGNSWPRVSQDWRSIPAGIRLVVHFSIYLRQDQEDDGSLVNKDELVSLLSLLQLLTPVLILRI